MGRKIIRFLLLALGVICGIVVLLTLINQFSPFPIFTAERFWQEKINDVESHAALWSKQGINKYKLKVRFTTMLMSYPGGTTLDCSQEIVVNHNVVSNTIQNGCGAYISLTVDTLFTIIIDKVKSRKCDPEGCKCGPMVVDVVYDPQYFYPKIAKTYYDFQSGWIFKTSQENFCMGMGGNDTTGITLEIYSFVPIQ